MRLALTHAYSWPEVRRGAERITHELSRALSKRGHDVTVFTSGSQPGVSTEDGVTTVRFRRRFRSAQLHERMFSALLMPRLAATRFDCVHSYGARDADASIRASRLRHHRTVYTNLGNPLHRWWDSQPEQKAHERVVRDVDAYGCMSRYSMRSLAEEYGREAVLTPGGVNLSQFAPAPKRTDRPTILFSGALDEPRKGLAVLIEACAIVGRTEPDLRLWLSGPGDGATALARAPESVRDYVEVLSIGDPEAQADRYGRAWVTALPSKHDSFGMVIVESLACGTPVVVSDGWALPELVSAGKTGVLCDPDDARSVADALCEALALSRRPGIAGDCRTSTAPYDWDTGIAPLFEKIYGAGVT